MTAPLSYTSTFGYYGLRVNPTFEQVLGTIRKPLHIPLPDRRAKWYANSPYRALLDDAGKKFEEVEGAAHMFRESGAEVHESANQVRPSPAGAPQNFDQIHEQARRAEENQAIEAAHQITHMDESRKRNPQQELRTESHECDDRGRTRGVDRRRCGPLHAEDPHRASEGFLFQAPTRDGGFGSTESARVPILRAAQHGSAGEPSSGDSLTLPEHDVRAHARSLRADVLYVSTSAKQISDI